MVDKKKHIPSFPLLQIPFKKLTNMDLGRLPSKSTISKFIAEAKVLADIEVGTAMANSHPEDSLGNIIHGDGTTKFHKKYQNFQITLADGTTRSMGLTQMADGNTTAVVEAFKERVQDIASEVAALSSDQEPANSTEVYSKLMSSISATMTDQGATMTDQGATMPQF